MNPRLVTTLVIASLSGAPAFAQEATNSPGSYFVTSGSIGGVPATILLDRATGKTWYLGEVDSQGKISIALPAGSSASPIWVPLSFMPGPPKIPPR